MDQTAERPRPRSSSTTAGSSNRASTPRPARDGRKKRHLGSDRQPDSGTDAELMELLTRQALNGDSGLDDLARQAEDVVFRLLAQARTGDTE